MLRIGATPIANTSDLADHEPEPTDAMVELETKH